MTYLTESQIEQASEWLRRNDWKKVSPIEIHQLADLLSAARIAELETALEEIKNALGGPGYARHCWFIADKALVKSGKSKYPAEFYEEGKHAQPESD